MIKISVSRVMNYNKIRYSRLSDLINLEYCNSNAEIVNLYIDLSSMFKSLYRQDVDIDDYLELTSSIINLCGYYRYFFRRFYNVHTRIYLLYSNNIPSENLAIYPEYNEKNKSQFTNVNNFTTKYIFQSLDLLSSICPYLPDIQFHIDYCETGVMIEYLKQYQLNYIPNIVLSRDAYNFQLVDDNTKVLVSYKEKDVNNNTFDSSYMVNTINAIYCYCLKNGTIISPEYSNIDGIYLSLLMALSRCPQRNIKSINKIDKALGMLKEPDILDKIKSDSILQNRYYICDIRQQLETYKISPCRAIINADIQNLFNKEEVQNLNNKYFSKFPLELESL